MCLHMWTLLSRGYYCVNVVQELIFGEVLVEGQGGDFKKGARLLVVVRTFLLKAGSYVEC